MSLPDHKHDPAWQRARRHFFAVVGPHLTRAEVEQYKRHVVRQYVERAGAELPDRLSLGLVPPVYLSALCRKLDRLDTDARGLVLAWCALAPAQRLGWLIERGGEVSVLKGPVVELVREELAGVPGVGVGAGAVAYLVQTPAGELRVVDLGAQLRVACV